MKLHSKKIIILASAFITLSTTTYLFKNEFIKKYDANQIIPITASTFSNILCNTNGYIIKNPGIYRIEENIELNSAESNSFAITIACDDVSLMGNGKYLKQINLSLKHNIGIQIQENLKNISIENLALKDFSGGGIWVHGNAQNIHLAQLKFSNCGFNKTTTLDRKTLPFDIPSELSFEILIDGGYAKQFRGVEIVDCTFSECGILRSSKNSLCAPIHSAICAYQGSDLKIIGCTIDGIVGRSQAYGITLASLSNCLIQDAFITDIFAKDKAEGILASDVDAQVQDLLQTSILAGVSHARFEYFLDTHESYKELVQEDPTYHIEANHLKGVIPDHEKNLELLCDEHKWREFRTLGRLVCHNSDKKSQTAAIYGKWVELFCDRILGVEIQVVGSFANLYPSGETPLPSHRDQYKKWIIGLSFGQTRTLEFVPDAQGAGIVSFAMESGDIFIFSPDVNNRYEHRMLPEPEKQGKRVNLTYFLEILPGQDCNKLVKAPKFDPKNIPTFQEAVEAYRNANAQ